MPWVVQTEGRTLHRVSCNAVRCIPLLQKQIKDTRNNGDHTILLENVSTKAFKAVLEYCDIHVRNPEASLKWNRVEPGKASGPPQDDVVVPLADPIVSDEDKQFMEKIKAQNDAAFLQELLSTSIHLGTEELSQLCGFYIALIVRSERMDITEFLDQNE